MKKFISTISILAIVIILNSCRSQEEDLETKTFNQETSIFKKTNDSIPPVDSTGVGDKPVETDPPPKNGHQW